MMQSNEIQKRFTQIESSIQQLKQAVQSQKNVPQDLQDCVKQLDQQSTQTRQALQSNDESRIVECVDTLEQTSDRAKASVGQAQVDDSVRKAVMQAHSELSTLKHQLH
jgi:phage shock protein A